MVSLEFDLADFFFLSKLHEIDQRLGLYASLYTVAIS